VSLSNKSGKEKEIKKVFFCFFCFFLFLAAIKNNEEPPHSSSTYSTKKTQQVCFMHSIHLLDNCETLYSCIIDVYLHFYVFRLLSSQDMVRQCWRMACICLIFLSEESIIYYKWMLLHTIGGGCSIFDISASLCLK
jgi:hypothetical protein